MKKYYCFLAILFFHLFCHGQNKLQLVDKDATTETQALYNNLHKLSQQHILFGHQHATEYGHGWQGDENRSDVKSVTGSHPALIGVDFSGLSAKSEQQIAAEKLRLKKNIEATYNRGGVTTASWHFVNPVYPGGFYWVGTLSAPTVKLLLPGGAFNEKYKLILGDIADLAKTLKGKDGKAVPVIFRPYHEFDGDWFWWGKSHCTRDEFVQLWKFTISYLRDSLAVHNFIYAFSPDNKFDSEPEYLDRYPGDDWVDMLGVDNYGDWGRDGRYDVEAGTKKLKIISDYALKVSKVAAFTETGLESIPNKTWWTETLMAAIKRANIQLAYVLVWRNDATSTTHFYAPFPGQTSAPDFVKFYNDPYTLFENDLKDIYTF